MKKNGVLKNILYMLSSNIIVLVVGITTGFIIPMTLSVENYGYFKSFTFYAGFSTLISLGLNDGIFVKYAGLKYEELPRDRFRFFYKVILLYSLIILTIGILISIYFASDLFVKYISISSLVQMVLLNMNHYFSIIHKSTNRFDYLSKLTSGTQIIYVILILLTVLFRIDDYILFILINMAIQSIILFVNIFLNREITIGSTPKTKGKIDELVKLIKLGIPILSGYFIGTLILSSDRAIINLFFTIENFAIYSFAFSLITVFSIVVKSAATVLFPYLKQQSETQLIASYNFIKRSVILFSVITFLGYWPVSLIVENYINQYTESLQIFTVLYSGFILELIVMTVLFNFIKIFGLQNKYLKINTFILMLAIILNLIFYFIWGEILSIAWASFFTFMTWYYYTDKMLTTRMKVKVNLKDNIFLLLQICMFLLTSNLITFLMGLLLYIVFTIINIRICYTSFIYEIKNILGKKS